MKVGVLTLHCVRNYGSVLQAYATQQLFHELGVEAEFIDYRRPDLTDSANSYFRTNRMSNSRLAAAAYGMWREKEAQRRGSMFQEFVDSHLRLSRSTFRDNSEILHADLKYDAFCVGSDQVWNRDYNGDNRPYYLSFAGDESVRFSFSSSIGISNPDDDLREELRSGLRGFRGLSVREDSAVQVLRSIGLNARLDLDPTLLVGPVAWRRLASEQRSEGSGYILVYELTRGSGVLEYARSLSKAIGVPILEVRYWSRLGLSSHEQMILPSVEKFLAYISHASAVVTDSFHGSAFALQFERPLYVVAPGRYSTRLTSLLRLVDGMPRLVSNMEKPHNTFAELTPVPGVLEKLVSARLESIGYLRTMLEM